MDPAVVLGKYEWVLIWGLSTFQEVFGSIAYLYVSIIYIYNVYTYIMHYNMCVKNVSYLLLMIYDILHSRKLT